MNLQSDCPKGLSVNITLNSLTALRITRSIRSGQIRRSLLKRCGPIPPIPNESGRWSAKSIQDHLMPLGPAGTFSTKRKLDVLVPSKETRLQVKGVRNTFRLCDYPDGSFVDLGDGIAMVGPELLFIELARTMDPAVHLLLGMELCGRFSRDADNPRRGSVTYDVEPVTSVDRLRTYAQQAHAVRGSRRALETIDRIVENAWSPMEAILAALIVLPFHELGYDLWPIDLNSRRELGERLAPLSDVESRVPDVMFRGTDVGLNYDGEDHFRLGDIARAAVAADRDPGNSDLVRELDDALAEARERIVADKRRDRDLLAMNLAVFSVTKEDFLEQGGLDRVIGQAIEALESSGKRVLSLQRIMLRNKALARARQDLIWSLMPCQEAIAARERNLARGHAGTPTAHDVSIEFSIESGETKIISLEEL